MTYPIEKIILFEIDKPIDLDTLLNEEPGIWSWNIINETETVDDDHNTTGYYAYRNAVKFNIGSFVVDNEPYSKVLNLQDLRTTNKSFYYDNSIGRIFVHFESYEPPLGKDLSYGQSFGFSKLPNNNIHPYYGGYYYPPLIINIPGIKKSIDPLFFGLLKYVKASVTLINSSGEFDDWRDRDLFGQPARMKIGEVDDDYEDFEIVFEGFVDDDTRDFNKFKIKIEDPRRALTQPVARNKLTTDDWPDLSESSINEVKPIAYGKIFNAESICLNEEDASAADRIFLICDTEFNSVDSLDTIYVDGVETAITGSTDLAAGIFTMTKASVVDNFDNVSIDFTATSTYDGIYIIKDLLLNYDSKPYIDIFFDTTEIDAATARDSSLYVNSGSYKLSKAIQDICVDIDARFFVKNNGKYTIRIYDEDRTVNAKEIEDHEWTNYPSIENNGSEFLSSVIIEYKHDLKDDKYLKYENTTYQDEVFDRYKKLKVGTYQTGLPTLTDAQDKSETIMNISKNVQDVVNRMSNWNNFGIEPSDFIVCSPTGRPSESPARAVYEVLKVNNNFKKFTVELSLRYVRDADDLVEYDTIDDNNDVNILDDNDFPFIGRTN